MEETKPEKSRLGSLLDPNRISRFMQWFLSGVLFVLGGILSVLLLMNTWSLIMLVFEQHQMGGNEILGSIVTWFLYFEFLALIAKYYQSISPCGTSSTSASRPSSA